MTVTLRTTSNSGATTKGSALTHAELDANFLFTQSGTGAVEETLAAHAKKLFFSDSFGTLQQAVTAAANGILIVNASHTITSAVDLPSNINIYFTPTGLVQSDTTSIHLFTASSKTNIKIRDGRFKYTAGSNSAVGGITLTSSSHCLIEGCDFDGMQFGGGVYAINSTNITIRGNHIHDTLSTHTQGGDILVHDDCTDVIVEGNRCYGSEAVGIHVQGASVSKTPLRTIIRNNYVNAKPGYGIMAYQITADDSETIIDGNVVRDIAGSYLAGASGFGIYVQTSGAAIVTNNRVKNCMASTSSTSNGQGAINIAFNGAVRRTNIVANNDIDAPYWSGIFITDAACETIITGNNVTWTDGTNGGGIYLVDSSHCIVSNNKIKGDDTKARSALTLYAVGADMTNNVVTGNIVLNGNGNGINYAFGTTYRHKYTACANNTVRLGGASAQAIAFTGCAHSVISGNVMKAPAAGLFVHTVTYCRGAGNVVELGTTNAFLSGGTCADTYFDGSNYWGSSTAQIQNTVTGVNIVYRGAAVPATGNWQVGDEWVLNAPATGTSPGSYCTVAGAPGTWKARAALA